MTEPIWLANARADLGIKEVPGRNANSRILQYYADAGHPEIDSDEVSWCGAFVAAHLKRCGYPIVAEPLVARNWRKYGEPLGKDNPRVGAIAVFWRESPNSWKGHVGIIVSWTKNTIKVLGGNQGNGVSIQSFPRSQLLEIVWPIEPKPKALEEAGSTEIAAARKAEGVLVSIGVTGAAVKTLEETSALDLIQTTGEHMTAVKPVLEGLNAIVQLVSQNFWLLGLGAIVAGWALAHFVIKKRVERHEQGQPLSRTGPVRAG